MEPEGILHRSRSGLHNRLTKAEEEESVPYDSKRAVSSDLLTMGVTLGPEATEGIPESLVEKAMEAEMANHLVDERAGEASVDDDERDVEDGVEAEDVIIPNNNTLNNNNNTPKEDDPSTTTPDGLFFHEGFLSFASRECLVFPLPQLVHYAFRTKKLDLSFNRLVNVKGLEKFVDLEELILDNNELTDDVNFPNLAKLVTLSVNKNRIVDLDRFASMCRWKFPQLTFLSLVGNDCCPNLTSLANSGDEDEEEEYQRYRYTVLAKMPSLKFLDFTPVSETERTEAVRRGKFLTTVKVDEKAVDSLLASNAADAAAAAEAASLRKGKKKLSDEPNKEYSPLPSVGRTDKLESGGGVGGTAAATKEAYGKCRYVYYGKQSEGNRFIADDTL